MFIGIGINMVGQMTATSLQALLFYANEPGFTFEPWDITTLYQDRAGTTPVTAAGQSVGLRLSKDQGLRQGPEVNPDPGFDNPAAWTFGGATPGWAVTGGKAECTATAGANRWVLIPNLLTVGATYLITADVIVTSGGCAPDVSTVVAPDATTSGTKRWIVTASTSTLQFIGRSNFIGSIDNVSFKTLAGNHEVAVSDAKRGVYGWMPKTGRRNQLTYTEQFDNAAWTKGNSIVTANAAVAPDGTTTADKLIESSGVTRGKITYGVATAVGNTISVYAKAAEWNRVSVGITNNGGLWGTATFNLSTGLVDGGASYGGFSVDTPVIEPVGNGWYRCSVRVAAGADAPVIMPFNQSGDPVNPSPALTGDGTSGIYIWGAQLEVGSTATAYQRVVSQYDITEAGVPTCYYVQADGVDDAYVTPTITPNTDKAQVFAGMRKLSDAATAVFMEYSASWIGNIGALIFTAPGTTAPSGNYDSASRGNIAFNANQGASTGTISAPVTNVITATHDIAGDLTVIRSNGSQLGTATGDKGTGNFLAYPAYIYSRGGTSLPFNGLDFGHAVRFGPNLDAATIARVETLIARNTPEVYL